MSEYQYYEWQTGDRGLTAAEQAAVGKLSSHIDVTSTRAWVEYHWRGFKHDPKQVLARLPSPPPITPKWSVMRFVIVEKSEAEVESTVGRCTTLLQGAFVGDGPQCRGAPHRPEQIGLRNGFMGQASP